MEKKQLNPVQTQEMDEEITIQSKVQHTQEFKPVLQDMKTPIEIDGYSLLQCIGKGYSGWVYTASKQGQIYAVKLINPEHENNVRFTRGSIIKEAIIMNELSAKPTNPHIIQMVEFSENAKLRYITDAKEEKQVETVYLAMQLAEGGTLADYAYRNDTNWFTEPMCRYFFVQFISALEHMYSRSFAHRDIKLDNLMLGLHYELLLGDFGFSSRTTDGQNEILFHATRGTMGHKAPEIDERKEFRGEPADIFAGAVAFFALRFCKMPFEFDEREGIKKSFDLYKKNPGEFWNNLRNGKSHCGDISQGFVNLWNRMFSADPSQRPTIKMIKKDPWFIQPMMTEAEVIMKVDDRREKFNEKFKTLRNIIVQKRIQKRIQPQNVKPGAIGEHRDASMAPVNLEDLSLFSSQHAKPTMQTKPNHQPPAYHDSSSFRLLNHYSPFSPDDLFRVVAALAHNIDDTTLVDPETFTVRLEKPQKSGRVTLEMGVFFTEEASVIRFLKIEGDYLEYLDAIEEIKEEIEKLENDYFGA